MILYDAIQFNYGSEYQLANIWFLTHWKRLYFMLKYVILTIHFRSSILGYSMEYIMACLAKNKSEDV